MANVAYISREETMSEIEKLSKAQQTFLEKCKEIGWGKVEVIIKDGEPKFILQGIKEIKLD